MSSYDAQAQNVEAQQQAEKGQEAFLTQQERATVARLLGHPEDFPNVFKSWLIDFLGVNPPSIPISQLTGFIQSTSTGTNVDPQNSTTSSAYVELDGGHPQISLGRGSFLILHGCVTDADGAGITALQSLKFNSEAVDAAHAVLGEGTSRKTVSRVVPKTFVGATNTVKCVYAQAGGGTGYFDLRWIAAIKYAN